MTRKRRPRALPISIAFAAALAGCRQPHTPLLSEREQFSGEVAIALRVGDVARRVAGELAFDRGTRNLQLTRRGEHTVVLLRRPDGDAGMFVDGEPVEPTDDDRADLQAVITAVEHPPGAAATITRREGGYTVVDLNLRLDVTLAEQPFMKGH